MNAKEEPDHGAPDRQLNFMVLLVGAETREFGGVV
jgi:hypothetical protein